MSCLLAQLFFGFIVTDAHTLQIAIRRTDLVLRFSRPDLGVAVDGTELPNLPGAVADILSKDGLRQLSPLKSSVVVRKPTSWVIEGAKAIRFQVVKDKEFFE